jgi:CheY-like chemotaxis protein
VSQLKERRPEIADYLLRCERDHLTQEDYTAMRNCVRSLLSLGRHEDASRLYKLAETMRDALDEKNPAVRINLISLTRVLLLTCHEALTTTPGNGGQKKTFSPPAPLAVGAVRPTLLSIDDDRIISEMVEAMFGSHATILTARNGMEGLEIIRRSRPDLVLLDDTMPKMTGMKVLETLHEDAELCGVRVIMVTSSDREQDIRRAMAAGAVNYVIKPFDPRILAEKVYKHLPGFV